MKIENQKTWTSKDMDRKTELNQWKMDDMKKFIEQCETDPKKDTRLEKQNCKSCMYQMGKLSMQAFTYTNCSKCNDEMVFPNSSIDRLCERCARMLEACKHCGSHID